MQEPKLNLEKQDKIKEPINEQLNIIKEEQIKIIPVEEPKNEEVSMEIPKNEEPKLIIEKQEIIEKTENEKPKLIEEKEITEKSINEIKDEQKLNVKKP